MLLVVLLGVLVLVVGGCVCVVWAERGGPRWVRGVATVTLIAGSLVRRARISRDRSRNGSSTNGSGLDG